MDSVDIGYWFSRGEKDAAHDRPKLFRHARRNSGGLVTAIGDGSEQFGSAEHEHEAGSAYLDGYASSEARRAS